MVQMLEKFQTALLAAALALGLRRAGVLLRPDDRDSDAAVDSPRRKRFRVTPCPGPMTITERAYTTPIWYTPTGRAAAVADRKAETSTFVPPRLHGKAPSALAVLRRCASERGTLPLAHGLS